MSLLEQQKESDVKQLFAVKVRTEKERPVETVKQEENDWKDDPTGEFKLNKSFVT